MPAPPLAPDLLALALCASFIGKLSYVNLDFAMRTSREYARLRNRMVDEQLVKRGINDRRVLDAMRMMPAINLYRKSLSRRLMKIDPCRSAKGKLFRNRTSSPL